MNTNVLEILNEYDINDVLEIQNINNGNTSNAKLVTTLRGKFILRKLRGEGQAITEFLISQTLYKHKISPEILLTNTNASFVEQSGEIYNLQVYLKHSETNNTDINFAELGRVTSLFHSKTQQIEGIFEQSDRFSLTNLWKEVEQKGIFKNTIMREQLTDLVEKCLIYNHERNCYIHGDLGKWKLLFNQKNIYIIDFGEVRKGNNHFDLAGVISSTLNWKQVDNQIVNTLVCFKEGYISNFNYFSWSTLRENFDLWFVRGMLATLNNSSIDHKTLSNHRINDGKKK